ncbi:transglycosylase family protein [Streptomyces diastaticus]|uniref:LysM peptidoglycan-binding domain-containing protein n=1 Tax=Streptomyces TaxID=1883 RepID=UPI000C268489|nr:transglycosylase family protein [Streptomyces sp. TSRI0384-2]PJM81761.1 transglycosylase [Streptomyces sp. TSRI0384-2]
MLSGNGRHRRPRQAPAFVVAAGVTGSAIAIPLLGAGTASAADTATWDRLAECESGGAWSTNAGNGYYGGLQITQDLWERHGGLSYAPSADLASRSQQIVVAERVLDAEGTAAWATCAPAIGLQQGGESADVNPGVPSDSGTPSASPSPTAPTGEGQGEGKGKGGDGEKGDKSDKGPDADKKGKGDKGGEGGEGDEVSPSPSAEPTSIPDGSGGATPGEDASEGRGGLPGTPSGTPSAAPGGEREDSGGGRHRGGGAVESGSGEGRDGSGRHASRGDRGDAPDTSGAYTVKEGDSLSVIAWLNEVDGGWPALYEANKDAVGADPDHILPGQALDLGTGQDAEKDRIGR